MGKTIGSCGHEIPDGQGHETAVNEEDRECNPCISFGYVCAACYARTERDGALVDFEEACAWANGKRSTMPTSRYWRRWAPEGGG